MIKVNGTTGQVAIIAEGTGPQKSNIRVFNPGMYKVDIHAGKIAIPTGKGWEVHDITLDQATALSSPDAIAARQTGVGSNGSMNPSPMESFARGLQQGVTLNTADEIAAAASGGMRSLMGEKAVDPNHPVTGGQQDGFGALYNQDVAGERAKLQADMQTNPKLFKAGRFAGMLAPGFLLPTAKLAPSILAGAGQGAIAGAGDANSQNLDDILTKAAIGAGAGAAGGGIASTASKVMAANTPTGMAYNAIDQASPSGIRALAIDTARSGGSAAEQSPVLADVLRNYSEQAPKQAAALVGPAQQRMAQVNQQAVANVDQLLSPENAVLYLKQVKQAARAANGPAYDAAYASPVRIGLPREVQAQPVFKDALKAAQAAAENEIPPRSIDPSNLSAQDIDLIDRMLQTMKTAAEKSQGDTSEAAIKAKATLPAVAQRASDTRYVADQAFPELASARSGAKTALQKQTALKLGAQALAPGREAVEIAAEYSALSPSEQEAYRVGIATKLRAMLASKGSAANSGQVFDKTGLAEKLVAVGFPQETVDKIVKGGMSARAVLNALQGGSDTAQKLLAAEAGKSPMSKVTPRDLILAALTNLPTMGGVKAMNVAGAAAERGAAKNIVEALASQDANTLRSLIFNSPQNIAPLVNILGRSAGINQGLSIFPRGYGQ